MPMESNYIKLDCNLRESWNEEYTGPFDTILHYYPYLDIKVYKIGGVDLSKVEVWAQESDGSPRAANGDPSYSDSRGYHFQGDDHEEGQPEKTFTWWVIYDGTTVIRSTVATPYSRLETYQKVTHYINLDTLGVSAGGSSEDKPISYVQAMQKLGESTSLVKEKLGDLAYVYFEQLE